MVANAIGEKAFADRYALIARRLVVNGLEILLVREDARRLLHLWRVSPRFLRGFPTEQLLTPIGMTSRGNLLYEAPAVAGEDLLTVMDVHSGRGRSRDIDRPPPELGAPLPLPVALNVVQGAAAAVARLDAPCAQLSPLNVLIDFAGRVELAPPMLAAVVNRACISCCGDVTQRLEFTNRYVSPEVAGGAAVDARSDVYSLAGLLYELCTGADPLAGTIGMRRVWQARSGAALPVAVAAAERGQVLPAELCRLIDGALAVEPGGRPQGAGEFLIELAYAAEASGVTLGDSAVAAAMERLFGDELCQRSDRPSRDALAATSLYCTPLEAALAAVRNGRGWAEGTPQPAPRRAPTLLGWGKKLGAGE